MDIKKFLAESEKTYRLRIKTVVPVDDAAMDKIERAVAKFHLIDISRPRKTMLQRAPLDFRNVELGEVWIIDVTFGLPASPSVVREDVRKALGAPEAFVVVRSHNDAVEIETERQNAIADIAAEAEQRGLTPASLLSCDPGYDEADEIGADRLSGSKYNLGLVAYLKQIEDRKKADRAKSDRALFNWIDVKPAGDDEPSAAPDAFNAAIPDAPTPYPSASKAAGFTPTEIKGDEDDTKTTLRRVYKDANGKRFVLSRTLGKE